MMFDLAITAITEFAEIAYYGRLWLVEFRDYLQVIVVEDDIGARSEDGNFILDATDNRLEKELAQ